MSRVKKAIVAMFAVMCSLISCMAAFAETASERQTRPLREQ